MSKPLPKTAYENMDRATRLSLILRDRSNRSRDAYINSRKLSEDWRETFAKWGYVPCVD